MNNYRSTAPTEVGLGVEQPDSDILSLVEIIELKWLLAGQGVHVHVEKLQQDGEYARELLLDISTCANNSVRDVAARLLQRMRPLESAAADPLC